MQEDRFSDASGSQQSAIEEATPINPLTTRRQKGQVKHLQYQVQNLSTTSSSHLQSRTKLKPFTSQSHQRLPGIQYNTNKLPQNKTSKLIENQLKVRQLALEVEEQGAPPDITMMMTQRGVNDIFDRKQVSTTVSRMLKSRIRSIREAKSQTQETKSKVQESVFHPKVRDFLKGQKQLTQIVSDLQKANQVFEQLSTRVSLYRVELGECMDKVLCTYSKI